jgi:F-type H+-transporting ATPase subunit epsilon
MQLKLITPEQELLSTEADYITVPGEVGELGILPQHTYLVSLLISGVMSYTKGGKTERFELSGGHVEVADDVVIVMADSATAVGSVDTVH